MLIALMQWAAPTWAAEATTPPPRLLLRPATPVSEAWPFVTVLPEKQAPLTLAEVQAAIAEFERPQTSYATLGVQAEPIWLHVPFRVEAVNAGVSQHWVMNIDYPPLNRIDAYIIQDGRTVQTAELGSLRAFASRPLLSRSHAMPLDLAAGDYDLMLRVESRGASILPIEFMQPSAFHKASIAEQMLRGIQAGLFLCMLMYSLAQWLGTREPIFIKYALLVTGSFLFALLMSGVGAQWVWRDAFWFEQHMAGIGSLVSVAGIFLFLGDVLRRPHSAAAGEAADRFPLIMNSGAALCGVLLAVYCLDAFNTRLLTAMIVLLGPLPLLLSLPRFISKVAKGEAIGCYLLLAFAFYAITVVTTTNTIRGKLPANMWTLHSLTFGEMCHILAITVVLVVRATELRKASEHARSEHEMMRSMAYADALTGLPNRRSLTDAMGLALVGATPQNMVAVYMIDLDDFKEINDTHGHEVGDQLLMEVASRLRAGARNGDVVARLGGDEFVMVASGLRDPAHAWQIGEHLHALFDTPIHLAGKDMRIGLTIGYSVATEASHETATLLRMADGALYKGKQGGKGRLQQV